MPNRQAAGPMFGRLSFLAYRNRSFAPHPSSAAWPQIVAPDRWNNTRTQSADRQRRARRSIRFTFSSRAVDPQPHPLVAGKFLRYHRLKRGLTLTPPQDFTEARDWFVEHKRDPFLWLIILGPLTMVAITFGGVLLFPPSDAVRAVSQVLPNADMGSMGPNYFPKCGGQTYIFGYNFDLARGKRVCRDIINGGWVVDLDPK
jgi:hypothetical protein